MSFLQEQNSPNSGFNSPFNFIEIFPRYSTFVSDSGHDNPLNIDLNTEYIRLQLERTLMEGLLHDNEYPDDQSSFWEPVKMGLVLTDDCFKINEHIDDCNICSEQKYAFYQVPCCNQDICISCVNKWFKTSVKCPYCAQDLRNFTDLKTNISSF